MPTREDLPMRATPEGDAAGEGSSRPALLVLCVGTLLLSGLRWVQASRVQALTSLPDEVGFLGNAWLLGRGEPAPPMAWAPFYPGGWSLLLAPAAALTDDPDTLAAAGRVLNIGLLAALVPILWVLLGRLGRLDPLPRALVALAAGALPGLWVAGVRAWPDALLALLWPLAVLALGALASRGPLVRRIWFGPALAVLWFAHARFLPVLLLGAALLVLRLAAPAWSDAEGRRTRLPDVLNLLLGALVVLLGLGINAYLERRWDRIVDSPLDTLFDQPLDTLGGAARSWLGQGWYALVATFGLAGVGAATLAQVVVRSGRRPRSLWTEPLPLMSVALLVGAAAVQVAAGVQLRGVRTFSGAVAFDLLANGRYQEVVLPPLVAVGLARLVRMVTTSLRLEVGVAMVTVALAVYVGVEAGGSSVLVDGSTVAATSWIFDAWTDLPVAIPTLLTVAVLALLAALRTFLGPAEGGASGRAAVVVPVAVVLAFSAMGLAASGDVVTQSETVADGLPNLDVVRSRAGDEPISFSVDGDTFGASFVTGWQLASEGLLTFEAGSRPPSDVILAPIDDDGTPATRGLEDARLVHHTDISVGEAGRLGLWVLPGRVLDGLIDDGLVYAEDPEADPPLAALQARVEPVTPVVTANGSSGPVELTADVTHAGAEVLWPSAPGYPAYSVVAVPLERPGVASEPVELPEMDPGDSSTQVLDLRSLASVLGPGSHDLLLQVRLPDGRPLQTLEGTGLVTLRVPT